MNANTFGRQALLYVLLFLLPNLFSSVGSAATVDAVLLKNKQEAESRGYVFLTSHDEIIAHARKEGSVRILGSLATLTANALKDGFRKRYPFIDVQVEEIAGTEVYLRMIQEMKAGLAKGWDVNYLAFDYYNEYLPFQKKFDILNMARQGVLQIPPKMVDPVHRHVVIVASELQVVAYNKKLVPVEKLPNSWEAFLKEEFRGRKFMLDIRPKEVAALVPAWGLERTLDFARKLAAQNPVWVRGNSRAMPQILSGEQTLLFGPNLASVLRAQAKDKTDTLAYKLLEPVPARLNETQAVLNTASHPHAGLLWLEFLCSPEGQAILDKYEPYGASVLATGSFQEKLTRGLKVSMVDWEHYTKMEDYQKKIVEAYGFPRAEKQ
jgi:iron(III) transport system substrate-binding protein